MKIALVGYGKMGKTIERIALERGHTCPVKIDKDNISDLNGEVLSICDVAIEFTGPESALENIKNLLAAGIPTISGSTGWLDRRKEVNMLCKEKNGAFLYASNYSIGVNIFFALNKKLAELMENQASYDVSIKEIHHAAKLDAPSGTGITLAEQIIATNDVKSKWVNAPSDIVQELYIESLREDPAPGTHTVTYKSDIDDIEITHTAHTRDGFALGAVLAAEFIVDKNGIYSMQDVLGI